jgi:imidazolonepropionase-like amidohydrolase
MRILIFDICIAVFSLLSLDIQTASADKSATVDKAPTAVAFVNVNVVPMDSERIVPGQTVIVRGDRISEVGPVDKIEIPREALRIDGVGKYLMPGLADMHAHLNYYDMVNLFLANGVTTIRSMAGFDRQLTIREKIQKGDLIGPTVHIAGPVIESNPPYVPGSTIVETADQAARIVAEHAKAGYEFIKIYDSLSLECFDAVIKTAAKYGTPVVGHVPEAAGIEHALASGMHSIEHLVGYGPYLELGDGRFWTKIDEEKMLHIAKVTSEAGAWNCVRSESTNRVGEVSNMKRMVKALHDAGAKILLGTDSQAAYVVAGFSIHEELQNLVDAGLTPYEAIRAGTRGAAECLGQLDEFGVVSVGLRADLILVQGNPL